MWLFHVVVVGKEMNKVDLQRAFTQPLYSSKLPIKFVKTPLNGVNGQLMKRVWIGGGNISCQLKFGPFVSCQLNIKAICQLSVNWLLIINPKFSSKGTINVNCITNSKIATLITFFFQI